MLNLDTLYILQQFIENSSTYICEEVNICYVADFFFSQISLWDLFLTVSSRNIKLHRKSFQW